MFEIVSGERSTKNIQNLAARGLRAQLHRVADDRSLGLNRPFIEPHFIEPSTSFAGSSGGGHPGGCPPRIMSGRAMQADTHLAVS
jgi:hypothetical protein